MNIQKSFAIVATSRKNAVELRGTVVIRQTPASCSASVGNRTMTQQWVESELVSAHVESIGLSWGEINPTYANESWFRLADKMAADILRNPVAEGTL